MISKTILLKAENNFGVDVVLEVQESVEKVGINKSWETFEHLEQYDHVQRKPDSRHHEEGKRA